MLRTIDNMRYSVLFNLMCRRPEGLPYARDSNVGQGFSPANAFRKPEGLPYASPNVGQGFSLAEWAK
jgi:hypothetical protein